MRRVDFNWISATEYKTRQDSWRRIYIGRVVAQSCNLSPPSLLLCLLCLLTLVRLNTIIPFIFSHQAPLVVPLAHSFPQLLSIGEVKMDGKAVDRIMQSTKTPLMEKGKKETTKKIIDMLCMSGRDASTSSLDPNNISHSVARESKSGLLVLMHSCLACLLFFSSCKRWSAVLYLSSIQYSCSNIRANSVLFPDINKELPIERSYVYVVRLFTLLSLFLHCVRIQYRLAQRVDGGERGMSRMSLAIVP